MPMEEMEDGKIKIEVKGKEYILQEIEFSKFKQLMKATTKPDGRVEFTDLLTKLISASLVEPKLKDVEVDSLPTSTVMQLTQAVIKLYNLEGDNFLQQSMTSGNNSSQ